MAAYTRQGSYPRPQERSYTNTRSPLAKAATMGFAYVKQNSYGGSASQPQSPPQKTYVADGFNSLPRPKRNGGQPQRRRAVNSALQGYFKSLNSMARSIVLETETVEKEHHEWRIMDNAKKEEVVNEHFIPQDIRLHYSFDFPMDRSVSQSSYCSAPPSWPGRPHSSHSMNDAYYNGSTTSLHLSQPSEWEHGRSGHPGYNHHSMVPSDGSLSLSQPSLSYNYDNRDVQASFSRLHKQQLSFRPSRKQHAVKKPISTQQPSRLSAPRHSLGSDGESQRTTSDEDYEIRNRHHQHLAAEGNQGFQRTKLRSYSMRARKGASNTRTSSTRGSMRTQRRKPTTPESNRTNHLTTDQSSRPSHLHYSTISTDTDYDAEIDLPEPSLMIDLDKQESRLNRRNSRNRRSFKAPKLVLNKPSPPSTLTRHTVAPPLDSSIDDLDIDESILDEPISIHRTESQDSLDTMTPSTMSKSYIDDDAASTCASEASRMTPDSMLSVGSYRPKTKQAEMAVLRNRRGKWGGSSYRHVTSNFADRHTQFKPNMLRNGGSAATSASTTRAPSPAESTLDQQENELLKPPRFAKYGSATESITSDLPHSPDRLSHLISPPITPSPLASSATYLFSDKRESGYISSSSESFQIGSRRLL